MSSFGYTKDTGAFKETYAPATFVSESWGEMILNPPKSMDDATETARFLLFNINSSLASNVWTIATFSIATGWVVESDNDAQSVAEVRAAITAFGVNAVCAYMDATEYEAIRTLWGLS